MELAIKNMVCLRCIKVVKQVLDEMEIMYDKVELGKAYLPQEINNTKIRLLKERLQKEGFDIVEDSKIAIVEKIKNLLIDLIYHKELDELKENLSTYLSRHLNKDYTMLSQLFSSLENTTIEQFFIIQKIEKVKELLVYDQLQLSEIAWKMGYSSVAHLSGQFKKITGFTPSDFKKLKQHSKQPIDKLV